MVDITGSRYAGYILCNAVVWYLSSCSIFLLMLMQLWLISGALCSQSIC